MEIRVSICQFAHMFAGLPSNLWGEGPLTWAVMLATSGKQQLTAHCVVAGGRWDDRGKGRGATTHVQLGESRLALHIYIYIYIYTYIYIYIYMHV